MPSAKAQLTWVSMLTRMSYVLPASRRQGSTPSSLACGRIDASFNCPGPVSLARRFFSRLDEGLERGLGTLIIGPCHVTSLLRYPSLSPPSFFNLVPVPLQPLPTSAFRCAANPRTSTSLLTRKGPIALVRSTLGRDGQSVFHPAIVETSSPTHVVDGALCNARPCKSAFAKD